MDEVFSICLDLSDQPLDQPYVEYFADDRSFVYQGERLAGYAVITFHAVIKAKRLPKGPFAQKPELIVLTKALQLATGVQANIYTDSKYAFTTFYVHGALYKEKGLIISGGKDIKYGQEILELLEAV
jgi:hypothetical protein